MVPCLFCSSDLLLHANGNHLYWYCDRCRERFSINLLQHYHSPSMRHPKSTRYRRSPEHSRLCSKQPRSHPIECLYRNDSCRPQVIRICNLPGVHWERVVLPGQCIRFQTSSTAQLEVIDGPMTTMIADRIPCRSLSLRSLNSLSKQPTSQQFPPSIMPA